MIQSRIMVRRKDDLEYYKVKNTFTLDMFLKADSILFIENNNLNF